MTLLELKEYGNALLKDGFSSMAISYYNLALQKAHIDEKLKLVVYSNLS